MIFFCHPTGNDFSSSGPAGAAGMVGVQKFMEGGGGYAGLHAATDFEQSNQFPFYTNAMTGAQFNVSTYGDLTPGNVVIVPQYLSHPVMRGLPANWNTVDEWYCMNKDINSIPGFSVLAQLTGVGIPSPSPCTTPAENRAVTWVKEFPAMDPAGMMSGRVFYTIRGHNVARYSEKPFRRLIHQGVLWAVHRLN
jgi:cytochrome c